MSLKKRIVIVANRLPYTVKRNEQNDGWLLETSAGGLASGLSGVKKFDVLSIGWCGLHIPDQKSQDEVTMLLAKKKCIPVFLEEEIQKKYYNGFSNEVLWQLLHYFGVPRSGTSDSSRKIAEEFECYKSANKTFANVVMQNHEPEDKIWVHDYHLFYVPRYLKEASDDITVGWFLHTPFPSFENLRMLLHSKDLLCAVLKSDLVGFHTEDYASHFTASCKKILGFKSVELEAEKVQEVEDDKGNKTRTIALPIGIDPERFKKGVKAEEAVEQMGKVKKNDPDCKIMLGIDRLDMIKGIREKLLAYEKFLEKNPEWKRKVRLFQIAIPTRTEVPEYKAYEREILEIAGRINGYRMTTSFTPLALMICSVNFVDLCALYGMSDVLLVTSLRDGMNLVSHEYVACQDATKKGVLVLSEFAGSSENLAGAMKVNPYDTTKVSEAMKEALEMDDKERERLHDLNYASVTKYTSEKWAQDFVRALDGVVEAKRMADGRSKNGPQTRSMLKRSREALGDSVMFTRPQ